MKLEPQPSPQSIATFTPTSSDKPKMMVGDLLRLLPKLVGLNSDLMTGNALLTVNGTVLQAPRLGVNGYRASSIHSSVVAKAALLSSGHSGPTVSRYSLVSWGGLISNLLCPCKDKSLRQAENDCAPTIRSAPESMEFRLLRCRLRGIV